MVRSRVSHPLHDPRDQNLAVRERIVTGTVRLLVDHGDEVVMGGLSRKRLCAITGLSRQTIHRHFPDDGSLLEALASEVLSPIHSAWSVDDLAAWIRSYIEEQPVDTEWVLRELARGHFCELAGDEYWPPWLALWALARHRAEVSEALEETWGWLNDQIEGVYQALLEAWGSTLAPPWTTRRLVHVLGSLEEGMTCRAAILGDEVDAELYADAVVAFVGAVVRPNRTSTGSSDHATLPGWTGGNSDPLDPAELTHVVAVTLDAARGHRELPSLSDIAERAGLPVTRLQATFEGHDALARSAGKRLVAQLACLAEAQDPDEPPLTRLRSHLEALAGLALEYPALAEYLYVLAVSPSARHNSAAAHLVEELAHPLEVLLRQARNGDQLTFPVTCATLARHLVDVLMAQALMGVGTDVEGPGRAAAVVDMTWRLSLAGLLLRDPA